MQSEQRQDPKAIKGLGAELDIVSPCDVLLSIGVGFKIREDPIYREQCLR